MSIPRYDMLKRLKGLADAGFEELIFRLDLEAGIPGKPASRTERAIEPVRAIESRGPEAWGLLETLLPAPPAKHPDSGPLLDLGRLPIPGPHFVGREPELARLDAAWEDPRTHVLTLVAFGGVGKSALVARWLDRMAADGWRGATRVL